MEDDGMTFLADTIRIERIREEEAYEGVRVLLEGRLANARLPLQIDVGFGDVITPAPGEVEIPCLADVFRGEDAPIPRRAWWRRISRRLSSWAWQTVA